VRKRLLEKARQFYGKFLQEHQSDAVVRREAGRASLRLGDIQEMLGEHVVAEQTYDQAIRLLQELRSEFPEEVVYQRELARGLHSLAVLLKKNSRFAEAESALQKALALREKLTHEAPGSPEFRQELEASRYQLAAVLVRLGKRDAEAKQIYQEVLA